MKSLNLPLIIFCFFICSAGYAGVSEAIEAAEKKIWEDFVSEYGFVLDYKGDFPTPQDCAEGRPNYLNWWGPTENAAKFTGLYLAAVCQRHTLNPTPSDAEKARELAKGLMLCASVSDVKGFISRVVRPSVDLRNVPIPKKRHSRPGRKKRGKIENNRSLFRAGRERLEVPVRWEVQGAKPGRTFQL